MHSEDVWKWLDAVDQDNLDALDQWGEPPPPHSHNVDAAKSLPPLAILLRNGSVRMTGPISPFLVHDVDNKNRPESRVPDLPTSIAHDAGGDNHSQLLAPGIITTGSEIMNQRADASSARHQHTLTGEGDGDPVSPKRLPTFPERARVRGLSGVVLQSVPVIQVEVADPVAINCQGARVVRGHWPNGLQSLPRMATVSRRHTNAGEGALHRSNALRRQSFVREGHSSHLKN